MTVDDRFEIRSEIVMNTSQKHHSLSELAHFLIGYILLQSKKCIVPVRNFQKRKDKYNIVT
jgi:hypothetical protein